MSMMMPNILNIYKPSKYYLENNKKKDNLNKIQKQEKK